jgi:hypothetical protein
MAEADSKGALGLKELAILAPIVGSSAALAYNVGFFYAIDISFFSFFTLSEHIVFALEAFPLALIVSFGIWYLIELWWNNPAQKEKLRTYRGRYQLAVFALLGVAYLFAYMGIAIFAAMAIGACYMLAFAIGGARWIVTLSVPFVLLVSMAAGLDMGLARKYQPQYISSLKTAHGDVVGTLVRSGERGVLFYFPETGEARAFRWDAVQELSSKPKKKGTPPWFLRYTPL